MPEVSSVAKPSGALSCARCRAPEPSCVVRTERLCVSCFSKYISTKVIKRLEANKIRAAYNETSKRLLIPISTGISSLCLLHILNEHVQRRAQQGRHDGYSIHLIFIDEQKVMQVGDSEYARITDLLMNHFPSYPLHHVALEDCFDYGIDVDQLLDRRSSETSERSMEKLDRLRFIFQATSSPSSRSDCLGVLRRSLIEAFAEQEAFDYILYGDSTTRLAERALSETAKGRGATVSYALADQTDAAGISFIYPLRDLLRKELDLYAETLNLPFASFSRLSKANVGPSLKDSSIDDLMRQYIGSVEEAYPSVVANVVRTTGKLNQPNVKKNLCAMCRTPLLEDVPKGGQNMTTSNSSVIVQQDALCYGCERTLCDRH